MNVMVRLILWRQRALLRDSVRHYEQCKAENGGVLDPWTEGMFQRLLLIARTAIRRLEWEAR